MTQDKLWLKKYQEVKAFIKTNYRNPSSHNPEERFKYCNWLKHNKKNPQHRRDERRQSSLVLKLAGDGGEIQA